MTILSEYTAIYEAGEALLRLLRSKLTPQPITNEEAIGLFSPFEPEDFSLTVWLFDVEDNTAPNENTFVQYGRDVQRIPPAQLRLSYLITAHSKAPFGVRAADEHKIMGRVFQTLRDNPVIPSECLVGSMAETGSRIGVQLVRTPGEQIMNLWTTNQKPYKLSFICKLSGIELDSERIRVSARVRDANIKVAEE